jgi:hypothetical protein
MKSMKSVKPILITKSKELVIDSSRLLSQWKLALIGIGIGYLFLMLISLLSSPAFGEIAFGVEPMEVQLTAPSQGSRVTDSIDVYNGGDVTLHISAYTADWSITESGEFQFSEPGSQPRSCANWIRLNPVAFVLEPKKIVRVRYTINTPSDLSGEYWAMIFFQSRPLAVKGSKLGTNISARVGTKVFLVSSQNLPKKGKITDMVMQPGNQEKFKVSFENSGMRHIRLKGKFEVRGEDGELLAKGELQPSNAQVLAGQRRELWVKLDKPILTSTYRLRAIVDYGNKELIAGDLTVKGDLRVAAAK